ncbi:17903_t:CDS:1 [Acaulospora morrowiae]|uniref:17903_t:CDS:1 n=1 Tax=Acaulospora morrowiae TaxID=94023 RepID=A0A9N9B4Q8_9GLOM|nr:17903_t:CDS:1 [Acaulospora morrowiae]
MFSGWSYFSNNLRCINCDNTIKSNAPFLICHYCPIKVNVCPDCIDIVEPVHKHDLDYVILDKGLKDWPCCGSECDGKIIRRNVFKCKDCQKHYCEDCIKEKQTKLDGRKCEEPGY